MMADDVARWRTRFSGVESYRLQCLDASVRMSACASAGLLREWTLEQSDKIDGGERIILWHEPTKTAVAYRPLASPPTKSKAKPRSVTLNPGAEAGYWIDKETGSRWDIAGRAVDGELRGWTLTWLDGTQVKWFAWAAEYPETTIYK